MRKEMFKKVIILTCIFVIGIAFVGADLCYASGKFTKNPLNTPAARQRNFLGDRKSGKYHLPNCKRAPSEINTVVFDSPMSAYRSGFKPCKRCNPPAIKTRK